MSHSGPTVGRLRHWEFRLPRQGNALADCQDAAAGNPLTGRFAVADGASESWNPGLWAQLLVDTFVSSTEERPSWADWITSLQQRWNAQVVAELGQEDPALPWYLEDQYRQGAFATFLGL